MVPDEESSRSQNSGPEVGDAEVFNRLFLAVYDELRRMARARMRKESPPQTLQTTALVHEVYFKLGGTKLPESPSARWLANVAGTLMERVLVDRARSRKRKKRGGDRKRRPLDSHDPIAAVEEFCALDMLALDDALAALAQASERDAEIVKLRFFAGLNEAETAQTLGVSVATIRRALRRAKAFLYDRVKS